MTQTLSAFVEAFPPAAGLLLQADGALLVQLTPLYSALIPELQRGLAAASEQTPAAAQVPPLISLSHSSRSLSGQVSTVRAGALYQNLTLPWCVCDTCEAA